MDTRDLSSFSVIVACLVLFAGQDASAQIATTGTVRGVVRDSATRLPILGATVVATSPALQDSVVAITTEGGDYRLTGLPAGSYDVTVYYLATRATRKDVLVRVGKTSVMEFRIDADETSGEVIEISGRSPIIDQGSTKTGVTIGENYSRNVPTGRTFDATLELAPGAQRDAFGISFYGATSPENSYIVDGFNVTGVGFGLATLALPNDFIEQTEVITGGYGAEFGRATGGIANVVTKAGSNEFHGSVYSHFTQSALSANKKFLPREGSSIAYQRSLDYAGDFGFEVGGPIIKDRLWFHVGFNPSLESTDADRVVSRFVDDDGDGIADTGDGGFSEIEELDRNRVNLPKRTYYFTTKLTYAAAQNHRGTLAVFGNPTTQDRLFDEFAVGPDSAVLFSDTKGAVTSVARWTSKFFDQAGELQATAGVYLGRDKQGAKLPGGDDQAVRFLYARPFSDFTALDDVPGGCMDGGADDPYPMLTNCPVVNYQVGGVDVFREAESQRFGAGLAYRHIVQGIGQHQLRLGADVEANRHDERAAFSGGNRWFDFGFAMARFRFMQPSEMGTIPCGSDFDGDGTPDATCAADADGRLADTQTINTGLFADDSWLILPNLTLNVGVRWDRQALGAARQIAGDTDPITLEPISKRAMTLNNISPRVGAIYDWTGEGRSRAYGYWGRHYESVPLDINTRGFSGEIINVEFIDAAACSDPLQPASYDCDQAAGGLFGLNLGGSKLIAPGTRGQYVDEFVAGVEYELTEDVKAGVSYTHRELGRALEDISPDGGNTFVVSNPGNVDRAAIADLRSRASAADMAGDAAEAARLNFAANAFESVGAYDRPRRRYDALELSVVTRFSDNFVARGSYVLSKMRGNFPGLFSPDTGQLDPNFTSMYDLPDQMANRFGDLPADKPHQLKVDGFYRLPVARVGAFVLGGRWRGASGRTHSVLGSHIAYGTGESFILERGANGRTSFVSAIDAHLAYGRSLPRNMAIEVFADFFNVFNQQTATRLDEIYTFEPVNPIVGGDSGDLEHLKVLSEDGTTSAQVATPNANFGKPVDTQAPFVLRLGARLTF